NANADITIPFLLFRTCFPMGEPVAASSPLSFRSVPKPFRCVSQEPATSAAGPIPRPAPAARELVGRATATQIGQRPSFVPRADPGGPDPWEDPQGPGDTSCAGYLGGWLAEAP